MPAVLDKWTVQPHGPVVAVDEGLLSVVGEIRMPLGRLKRRMTIVALGGNRSLIYSAIALDEPGMARIEALGEPAFLVVPNAYHRLDARIWKQRYPGIKLLAPHGARAAVEEVVPVDTSADVLDDPQTDFLTAAGTAGREAALLVRRPAGTSLVICDLIAHLSHPGGIGAWLMARLLGLGVSAPQVPRTSRRMLIADKPVFAGQLRAWASEPRLARILPAHGEIIDKGPAATLHRLADGLASP